MTQPTCIGHAKCRHQTFSEVCALSDTTIFEGNMDAEDTLKEWARIVGELDESQVSA